MSKKLSFKPHKNEIESIIKISWTNPNRVASSHEFNNNINIPNFESDVLMAKIKQVISEHFINLKID